MYKSYNFLWKTTLDVTAPLDYKKSYEFALNSYYIPKQYTRNDG